jgi:hypothetical protein
MRPSVVSIEREYVAQDDVDARHGKRAITIHLPATVVLISSALFSAG